MRWLDHALLPAGLLAGAALAARFAHAALGGRRALRDRGGFWFRVALESGLALGLASLVSGWLETLQPALWQRGWHAHFDLVPGRFSLGFGYAAALALPLALWCALVLASLAVPGLGGTGGRRDAPQLGPGRSWALAAALPLAAALVLALPRLGGGPGAYPGFTWGTLAVVLVSLLASVLPASAEGASPAPARRAPDAAGDAPRKPWPQALRDGGVDLTPLATWPARRGGASGRPSLETDLGSRLARSGARQVPSELVVEVEALLSCRRKTGEHGPALLVFGAEDDGRLEVVAAAAASMAERFLRRTLVVCPRDAAELAADLGRFLPVEPPLLAHLDRPGEIDPNRPIWAAAAEAFAETILRDLAGRELAAGVGLVVWWDLHRFTGVPAANLWAVSHRLYRLLSHRGAGGVRTLALAWRSRHPEAQVERYVRRLLPHADSDRRELHLEPTWRRPTDLHLLGSTERFFRFQPEVLPERTHPLVVAARASIEAAWPTHLALPAAAAEAMTQPLTRVAAGGRFLGEALSPRAAEATVRLLALGAHDALALPERASELGRAVDGGGSQHVGVLLAGNPYVEHLLSTLAGQPASLPAASRRLVAAVGKPRILNRHLLRALAELPGTGASLRRDFLAHEAAVDQTLDALLAKGELKRKEIRFLSPDRRLCRDFEYQSLAPSDGRYLPFESAGGELIDVRDPAAAHDRRGVVFSLDVERVLIEAYPHRIFTREGRRYRVREWGSVHEVKQRGALECELEARPLTSLRLRRSLVQALRLERDRVSLGRPERGLTRQLAGLTYEEWVDGALHLTRGPSGRTTAEKLLLERPLSLRLSTSALLLLFPEGTPRPQLTALAQGLRLLLPVHLGVGEDDLEVVALGGTEGEPRGLSGLALVELYEGGFGLLEPLVEDGGFLLDLLERTRSWLATCRCRSADGCDHCLFSVSSQATHTGHGAGRAAALEALERVLG